MDNINRLADSIVSKIKHYLVVAVGRTADEAQDDEFYRAFVWALREQIMANWAATDHAFAKHKVRKIHYLSMEYMPGRLLTNNITNISAGDVVSLVMKKMNRQFEKLINLEHDIGIGNGGLGRLASCLLDSLATQQYPAVGYGLRYQYGIFEQDLRSGVQIERPDIWLLIQNPWELRRDSRAVPVQFKGQIQERPNSHGDAVYDLSQHEEIRALPFDYPIIGYQPSSDFTVLTLRLWSTKESPRNFSLQCYNSGELGHAAENTSLTDVLYPNDNNEMGKRIRLKQEFLLTSASLQDIVTKHLEVFGDMSEFADKVRIQINDTHPALMIAEMIRMLTTEFDLPWGQAKAITQTVCSYTNHTVLKEALEEWNINRMQDQLPRQYRVIERLNHELCHEIQTRFPGDEERINRMTIISSDQVKMAHLAIYGSHKINGVAKLHSTLLKDKLFKDFYELFPDKFLNVTNGVTQRRWLMLANPKLTEFINERIGFNWVTDFKQIAKLSDFADDVESQKAFLTIKRENKQRLLNLLCDQESRHCAERPEPHHIFPDEHVLFDVQIKRIHEYKRQLMNVLYTLMTYHDLQADTKSHLIPRLVLIGGKAAPGYVMAKNIIRLIFCLSRKINVDPKTSSMLKIFFLENYNVSSAEIIIPAADLSEQISMAGMEASGTGNMKLSMNGALTIGTEDGANIEMHEAVTEQWWPFSFGLSAQENRALKHSPKAIYESNTKIRAALDSLVDGSLTETDEEARCLKEIFNSLLTLDRFHVLQDLMPYYETQMRVEELFVKPEEWAKYAIHNIAGMGRFSTDESIANYAKDIWDLQPCPPDSEEITRIKAESKMLNGPPQPSTSR